MRASVTARRLAKAGGCGLLLFAAATLAQVHLEVAPAEIPALRANPVSVATLVAPDAPV
jgi:hypothetical protein